MIQLEGETLRVVCLNCGIESEFNLSGWEPQFLEEFKQYENYAAPCEHCGSMEIININLPEHDEMELDVMEELAPPEEVEQRKKVRDLMWKKRPDLKKKDRKKDREDFVKKNQINLDEIRAGIAERKAARESEIKGDVPNE